jgi:hypothetical protein
MKINQGIVNDVIYKYAKFHYEILCIMGYTKIKKSDKICTFEIYSDLNVCYFCVAQNTKYLNKIFGTLVG